MADQLAALTVHAWDITTGRHLARIPYTACSWSDSISEPGSMSVDIVLNEVTERMDRAGVGVYAMLRPWRVILSVQRGPGMVKHAGPVTSREWDPVARKLSLSCGGGWTLLGRRLVLNHNLDRSFRDGDVLVDDEHPAGDWLLHLTGSYSDIARGLVAEAMKWGTLPIALPAVTGGAFERNYGGYDLATTADRLSDLAGLEDGDEIRFTPRVIQSDTGDRLEFLLQSAREIVDHEWRMNAAAPGQRCYFTKYGEDGAPLTTDVWAAGGKDDDKTVMARRKGTTLTAQGWPVMQTADKSHTTVSVLATLQAYAASQLAAGDRDSESFALKAGEEWDVHVGDHMDVRIDDLLLGDRSFALKITDVSGSADSDWITLQARRRS